MSATIAIDEATFSDVTPDEALGDRNQNFFSFSDEAEKVLNEHQDERKKIEIIKMDSTIIDVDRKNLLGIGSNGEIARKIKDGVVAPFVKVAKIERSDHPVHKAANLFSMGPAKMPGFIVYTNEDLKKGQIIGSLCGKICLGREFNASMSSASSATEKMRKMACFDLVGSRQRYGGWVQEDDDYPEQADQEMLVLDYSEKSNVLSLISDVRNDPYRAFEPRMYGNRGEANITWVEFSVDNIPRILAVASKPISKGSELMYDLTESQRRVHDGIYEEAKVLYEATKLINQLTDRIEGLESDQQPLITMQVRDNRDVKSTRNIAMAMANEWEDAVGSHGDLFPRHALGELREEVYMRGAYANDAEKRSELISKHQNLINNPRFLPKKPREVQMEDGEKKTVYVDNDDCEEFLTIYAMCGTEIATEVARAWLEFQEMSSLSKGRYVPWDPVRGKLMENSEIVMRLTAKCMVLQGLEPCSNDSDDDDDDEADGSGGGGNDEDNDSDKSGDGDDIHHEDESKMLKRKFRKIFNEVDEEHPEERKRRRERPKDKCSR